MNHSKSAKITRNSKMNKCIGFPGTSRSISLFIVIQYVHGDVRIQQCQCNDAMMRYLTISCNKQVLFFP